MFGLLRARLWELREWTGEKKELFPDLDCVNSISVISSECLSHFLSIIVSKNTSHS